MAKQTDKREAVARWLYVDDGMVEYLCDWDKALPHQRDTYFRKADQILALFPEPGLSSDKGLLKWAKRHHWDSLERDKDLIIRHLRTYSDE